MPSRTGGNPTPAEGELQVLALPRPARLYQASLLPGAPGMCNSCVVMPGNTGDGAGGLWQRIGRVYRCCSYEKAVSRTIGILEPPRLQIRVQRFDSASGLQRADAAPLVWVPALIPGSSVVEQAAVNRWVDGSNPSRGANHDGGSGTIFLTPARFRRLEQARTG